MRNMVSLLHGSWTEKLDPAAYRNLLQDNKELERVEESTHPLVRRLALSRRWFNPRRIVTGVAFACLILVGISVAKTSGSTFKVAEYLNRADAVLPNSSLPLHLILPATSTDVNLCKVMLSASLLGYPAPVLINWKVGHEPENIGNKLSHRKKLSGVIEYIKSLKPEQSEDLVLMVDAFDVWFQLRVEVLIERYYATNREADDRLANEMGTRSVMRSEGIHNSVIMGSDKFCWTLKGPWCWLMPESPLPEDSLGEFKAPDRNWILNEQVLPRYLNSGFVMGPASKVKAIFERAEEYISAEMFPLESDQHYVSMVFAEQQLYRNIVHRQHGFNAGSPIADGSLPSLEKQNEGEELGHLALVPGHNYEFGIHLDYFSSLTHTGIRSFYDTKFLYYNSTPVWPEVKLDPKYDCKLVVNSLPADVERSPGPFSSLDPSDKEVSRPWSDIPLFTDICTGQIPASVHHNGDKTLREKLWQQFWMQPRSKDLFGGLVAKDKAVKEHIKWKEGSMIEYKDATDAASALTHGPKSSSPGGDGIGIGGALGDGGEKLTWDELCVRPGYEEQIFKPATA